MGNEAVLAGNAADMAGGEGRGGGEEVVPQRSAMTAGRLGSNEKGAAACSSSESSRSVSARRSHGTAQSEVALEKQLDKEASIWGRCIRWNHYAWKV